MRDRVDLTQRMIYLRSIPVASMLSTPVLKIIAANLLERSFQHGEPLMKEGEPISGLHLLTEGKVSLTKKGSSLGALSPPQSLGFLGILAKTDGPYDAAAEEPTRALELETDTLLELLEDHFELTWATLRYLCERLLYEIQELPAQAMQARMEGSAPPVSDEKLDLVERVLYLRGLRAYSSANLNALALLSTRLVECRFAPGERIWDEGAPAGNTLLVRAGTAICTAMNGTKRWRVEPNSAMGGLEVIASKPRWYTVEAESPLVGFWMASDSMIDLFEDDFTMSMNFVSMIAKEVLDVLEKKASLGQSTIGVKRDVTNLGPVPVGA
jgi:CRP-like cAMP-binding protein